MNNVYINQKIIPFSIVEFVISSQCSIKYSPNIMFKTYFPPYQYILNQISWSFVLFEEFVPLLETSHFGFLHDKHVCLSNSISSCTNRPNIYFWYFLHLSINLNYYYTLYQQYWYSNYNVLYYITPKHFLLHCFDKFEMCVVSFSHPL